MSLKDRMTKRMLNSDVIEKQLFKITESENTIVLSKSHSNTFLLLIGAQTVLTLISMIISIGSTFREDNELSMSRSSYWWHFFFGLIVLVSLYRSLSAINKTKDNTEDFACFLFLIIMIIVIEFLIISNLFLVSLPLNRVMGQSLYSVTANYITVVQNLQKKRRFGNRWLSIP